jgi:nucleoside transporter
MNNTTRFQLSLMMFLQYFVWGCWYVTMGTYLSKALNCDGSQIGSAYASNAIAAMISPFFIGYIADRYFNTERLLGVMHLLGAVLMYFAAQADSFDTFFPILLGYSLVYMPTLALSNALCFHHIKNPEKDFPSVRVLGTIGWIAAGLTIGYLNYAGSNMQFILTAIMSVVMGLYCFTMPATPPKPKAGKTTISEILGLDALSLLKDRSFAIMVIASVLFCIPLNFYYSFAGQFLGEVGLENVAGKMTLGQMSEIGFMLLMPFFLMRLGVKYMIIFGLAAWIMRYMFFAYGNADSNIWMLYVGILLHGICYDFFFVTGQIYTDNKAPLSMRSSAQGLITFATYGVGFFFGARIAGEVVKTYEITTTQHNWQSVWYVPTAIAAVILVLFWVMFKDDSKTILNKELKGL